MCPLVLQNSCCSGAKKARKHKETHLASPISDPILKFFIWGPLLLENEGEGATHIKNLGLHQGPLHSLCGYFFMCFFRFLAVRPVFCTGGGGVVGSISKQVSKGSCSKMLVGGGGQPEAPG